MTNKFSDQEWAEAIYFLGANGWDRDDPGAGNAPAGPDPEEDHAPANDPEEVVDSNPTPAEETPEGNEVKK